MTEQIEPNIILALPLYKQVPAKWLIHLMGMDQSTVIGQIFCDGIYITEAMKRLVQQALALDGWEWFVTMEHDMIVPLDALTRVAMYKPEQHIVGSMYFGHEPPFSPVAMLEGDDGMYRAFPPDEVKRMVERPGIYECHAVGFGFTAIHRDVLEKWDPNIPMFMTQEELYGSHDIYFCAKAREQGFKVYVDTGNCCNHLTQISIGYAVNQAHAERNLPDAELM